MFIAIGDNLFESNQSQASSSSPTNQTYVDQQVYLGENREYEVNGVYFPNDCKTVLKSILEPKGLKIYQKGGVWYITRIAEIQTTYTVRLYRDTGGYLSNFSVNPAISVGTSTIKILRTPGRMEIEQAYKKLNLLQTYGAVENLIIGGGFPVWEFDSFSPTFKHWVNVNLSTANEIGSGNLNEDYYVRIKGRYDSTKYLETDNITVHGTSLVLTGSFEASAGTQDTTITTVIYLDDTGGNYYTWGEDPDTAVFGWNLNKVVPFSFQVSGSEGINFDTFDFRCDPLPVAGILTMRFYQASSASAGSLYYLDNAVLMLNYGNDPVPATLTNTDTVDPSSTLVPEEKELILGDIDNLTGLDANIVYEGCLRYNSTTGLTSQWDLKGSSEWQTLLETLAQDITKIRETSTQKLTVTLKEVGQQTISIGSTITSSQWNDKLYMIDSAEFWGKANIWRCTLLEIPNDLLVFGRITEDDNNRITEDGNERIVE